MTSLASLATGRDNNLNLIRTLAALAVLVSHAVPIALGKQIPEPLTESLGQTLGFLAVLVFFAISGFLITASYERSSSPLSFALARFLRLMPGLFVSLIFVAFLLGPLVTTLQVADYLAMTDVYTFFIRNLTLFSPDFTLPGIFDDQPFQSVVGSIWTLRHEVACYAGVFIAGLLGFWRNKRRASLLIVVSALAWVVLFYNKQYLPLPLPIFLHLALPFGIGAAFHVWRDRIPMSIFGVALTVALAWAAKGSPLYFPTLAFALSYTTFWLAYVPGGPIRAFNRLGDYSYGIYVYAFPIQGWAVWAFGPQTPIENILYSLPPTLLLSILSWHLVEKPAMAAKPAILAWLYRHAPFATLRGGRPNG